MKSIFILAAYLLHGSEAYKCTKNTDCTRGFCCGTKTTQSGTITTPISTPNICVPNTHKEEDWGNWKHTFTCTDLGQRVCATNVDCNAGSCCGEEVATGVLKYKKEGVCITATTFIYNEFDAKQKFTLTNTCKKYTTLQADGATTLQHGIMGLILISIYNLI